MKKEHFKAVNTGVETVLLNGREVLRVVETEKLGQPDENTYARLLGESFHSGIIEVEMLSRLLPDAPDHARGFIGIAFRINDDDTEFESFYVRPTNGTTEDPVRKAHGCQYFSYPTYTFAYFREHGMTQYEAPISFGLNEWVHLRAVIDGAHSEFYLNHSPTPTLVVDPMLHGAGKPGAIGLFVDIGTEAFFKDLKVTPKDASGKMEP